MTTEERITRREALQRLVLLGLSAPAITTLLAACSDDTREQAGEAETRSSGTVEDGRLILDGPSGDLTAAFAPADKPKGAVLVIHDESGLTPHFAALPGRLAESGYTALAVDLLSGEGGTAQVGDAARVQQALSSAPKDRLVADLRAGLDELARREPDVKLGALGFEFGGGMAWSLLDAPDPRLAAVTLFDGPFPEGADLAGAKAAVMAIYAGTSPLNAGRPAVENALIKAGLPHEVKVFIDTEPGFFNDAAPQYQKASADAAYAAVLDWFSRHLT